MHKLRQVRPAASDYMHLVFIHDIVSGRNGSLSDYHAFSFKNTTWLGRNSGSQAFRHDHVHIVAILGYVYWKLNELRS